MTFAYLAVCIIAYFQKLNCGGNNHNRDLQFVVLVYFSFMKKCIPILFNKHSSCDVFICHDFHPLLLIILVLEPLLSTDLCNGISHHCYCF